MEINNDLVEQWEPKIQKMVSSCFIVGLDNDDIAQELRISLIKAAKKFDSSKGVIFHTYIHISLLNTIRTLISKAQRKPILRSIDTNFDDIDGHIPSKIIQALATPSHDMEEMESSLWLDTQKLEEKEKYFVALKLKGLTMDEISIKLKASGFTDSSYKVRQALSDRLTIPSDDTN